jgi:hypothetical protein
VSEDGRDASECFRDLLHFVAVTIYQGRQIVVFLCARLCFLFSLCQLVHRVEFLRGLAFQMVGSLVVHLVFISVLYTAFDSQVERVMVAKLQFATASLQKDRR